MSFKTMFQLALLAAGIISASSNLETITTHFRKAQLRLLQESKASSWGRAWVPDIEAKKKVND